MDWQKERQEFLLYLQKETGINAQAHYEQWQLNRGCFWQFSVEEIIECACLSLNVKREHVESKNSKRDIADARKIIAHHLRPKLTLKLIGSVIGGLHHTSVMAAQKEYHSLYEKNTAFKAKADQVIVDLYNLS